MYTQNGSYLRKCNSFGSIFQEHRVKIFQFTCVPARIKTNKQTRQPFSNLFITRSIQIKNATNSKYRSNIIIEEGFTKVML